MEPPRNHSGELQKTTKEMLEDQTFPNMPEGVPLKHIDGAFGLIKRDDALSRNWVIEDRNTGEIRKFESVDELINHGWAID